LGHIAHIGVFVVHFPATTVYPNNKWINAFGNRRQVNIQQVFFQRIASVGYVVNECSPFREDILFGVGGLRLAVSGKAEQSDK
jgi:hypothetical protein